MQLILLAVFVTPVCGQDEPPSAMPPDAGPGFGLLDQLGLPGGMGDFGGTQHILVTGQFQIERGSRAGRLAITATLDPHWHVYSITQKDGGPQRSELKVGESDRFQLRGPFQPDPPPKIKDFEYFDVPVEEHSESVTWTAPIQLADGTPPEDLVISVTFDGQVCEDGGRCIPIEGREIQALYAGSYEPPASPQGDYRPERSHITIGGRVEPTVVRPGQAFKIVLSARPDPEWHIYAYAKTDPEEVSKPTLIAITPPSFWKVSPPAASAVPVTKKGDAGETVSFHDTDVSWTVTVQVPEDAQPGEYQLAGSLGFQTCTESLCDRPMGTDFSVAVAVGSQESTGRAPLAFAATSYGNVAKLARERSEEDVANLESPPELSEPVATVSIDFWAKLFEDLDFRKNEEGWSHSWFPRLSLGLGTLKVVAVGLVLIMSFLAGLILNVMPCVLPVIGLKLMSFISQAGESRWRVFILNVWYSLGMWLVFLVFATVAAVLHLFGETFSWGEHLGDPRFSIPLLSLVYVLGLSMFGVWEIPIPGFMGSGAANELAEKEGPAGAFFKGVLTTILATPCSGPFIGVAVGIAVIAPIWLNFSVFTGMALGMATPYLIVGAFPRLIKWLPKPGNWMVTLKEFMGFILMGTGVWIIYFLEDRFVVATLAMLIGLGTGCWIIGRILITATLQQRFRAWILASVCFGVGVLMFAWLVPPATDSVGVMHRPSDDSPELPWEPFTPRLLNSYREQGVTILIDFTADW